jgi:hypothetical protein
MTRVLSTSLTIFVALLTQNRHVFEIRQKIMRLYDLFPTRL